MVKVKLCGNRSLKDVEITKAADAQGFIVETPESSRNLELSIAKALIKAVPLFNSAVIVTKVKDPKRLAYMVSETQPDALQVHSELEPDEVERLRKVIPTSVKLYSLLSVTGSLDELRERAEALASSSLDALILDTKVGSRSGGTGLAHNWRLSRKIRDAIHPFPVVLAGGLKPDNVIEAIKIVRPYAIDVSSGVEENGAKSKMLVNLLLSRVRSSEEAEAE